MKWSDEAKKALAEVPLFVQDRVRKLVEEEAGKSCATEVSLEYLQACRKHVLTKMEDEVKGYQVETCFGPGGCPNRAIVCASLPEQVRERLAARDIKSFLRKIVPGPLKVHHEFRVSLSDCPNACSRPQIVDVGLIGACRPGVTDKICSGCGACAETCQEEAISFVDNAPIVDIEKCLSCGKCIAVCHTGTLQADKSGYRIMLGGKLGRHPRLATELHGIFDKEEIPAIIDRCLDYYQSHCTAGERLGEIMERNGAEEIEKIITCY